MFRKTISGIIAFLYLAAAYFTGGVGAAVMLGIYLLFPLGIIWLSDPVTASRNLPESGPFSKISGDLLIAVAGWILLSIPFVVGFIDRMQT